MKALTWHPTVAKVLRFLTGDLDATVDAQLEIAAKISHLADRPRQKAMDQLATIAARLAGAGEAEAARLVAGIAFLADEQRVAPQIARRVAARLDQPALRPPPAAGR